MATSNDTNSSQLENEDDDLLLFELPSDNLPGSDRLSKCILRTPTVINIVATGLLDIPNNTYTIANTEWKGSRCDILYIPNLAIQQSLPPILVEVQKSVNESFMRRLLQYSLEIVNIYNAYPLVLVICTGKVSPTSLQSKFIPVEGKPWLRSSVNSDYWAKVCYLTSSQTLIDSDVSLTPLQALASFMIEQAPSLFCHTHCDNPTIKQLYRLSNDCQNQIYTHDYNLIEALDIACSTQTNILEKAKKSLKDVPGTSKTVNIIDRGLEYNARLKRKFSTVTETDSSDEPLDIPKKLLLGNASSLTSSASTHEKSAGCLGGTRRPPYATVYHYGDGKVKEKGEHASLSKFVEENPEYIVTNTPLGENLQNLWGSRFGEACRANDVEKKLSKPDWGKVALEIFQRGSSGNGSPSELASNTQRTSARSDSSTASTNTSSYSMSSCDISEVKRVYNSLDADKCWKLSTGKVVEKEIEKLALSCKFEHSAHSLILDPNDPTWAGYFTDAELQDIWSYGLQEPINLPEETSSYIAGYKNLVNFTNCPNIIVLRRICL
ncbi:hypothetical protein VTP01DRAFT_2355 [Rhizomucor pusillus]|uniref:uncharacterized protein n=1 Tax=Rhizomucor pusillus TaxID=4840 RepID=UPI003742346B